MGKQYQIRNGVVTEITPQVAAMVPVATTTTDGLMSAADKSKLDSMVVGLSNVYLSPSGNDANDGKTAATAVATFAQAMKLARQQSYLATDVLQKQTIVVAAGSYTEDVTVDGLEQHAKFKFYLDGAVSITGDVTIANSAAVEFANGNFTVAGKLVVKSQSYCFVGETLTVVVDGGTEGNAITVTDGSFLQCASDVSVSGTGRNAIECAFSRLSVGGDATFAGTWTNRMIVGSDLSSVIFTNVKSSGVDTKAVATAANCSYIYLGNVDIVNTGTPTTTQFGSNSNSTLAMDNVTFSGSTNSAHDIFSSIEPSVLVISGAITVTSNGTTTATRPRSIFCASEGGLIRLAATTATHTINANVYGAVVYAVYDGLCSIYTSANFAGTVTGKKYALGAGGRILKGASKLNGSAAGTLDTATYCFAVD